MLYFDFTAGNKDYRLVLNTRSTVMLEKTIGCNPLHVFGNGETIPPVTTMVSILHASLQKYHHGISLADAYDIFDAYLDDGHTVTDFLAVILGIYKVSGILPKGDENEAEGNEGN